MLGDGSSRESRWSKAGKNARHGRMRKEGSAQKHGVTKRKHVHHMHVLRCWILSLIPLNHLALASNMAQFLSHVNAFTPETKAYFRSGGS